MPPTPHEQYHTHITEAIATLLTSKGFSCELRSPFPSGPLSNRRAISIQTQGSEDPLTITTDLNPQTLVLTIDGTFPSAVVHLDLAAAIGLSRRAPRNAEIPRVGHKLKEA